MLLLKLLNMNLVIPLIFIVMWGMGSEFPTRDWTCTLHWKHRVLTARHSARVPLPSLNSLAFRVKSKLLEWHTLSLLKLVPTSFCKVSIDLQFYFTYMYFPYFSYTWKYFNSILVSSTPEVILYAIIHTESQEAFFWFFQQIFDQSFSMKII